MARALSSAPQAWKANLSRSRLLVLLSAVSALSLVALVSRRHSSSTSNPRRTSQTSSTDSSVVWHDHELIKRFTRPSYHTIVPTLVSHLSEFNAPAPFEPVYVVSAWLDTRPIIGGKTAEVVLLSSTPSKGFFDRATNQFPENLLWCFLSIKRPGRAEALHISRPSILQPQDAPDGHPGQSPWIYAQYSCPLETAEGEPIKDWEGSEIFATLSLPKLDPFHNSFVWVNNLPKLDLSSHKKGQGISAMCLPPLSGDFYAPFLADYFAHYRALGFSRFYPYLLDPGPETIKVLRELMWEYDGIEPVRWSIPKGWLQPTSRVPNPIGQFAVAPVDWHIDGIDNLPVEVEAQLAAPAGGPDSVKLWYYGQGPAEQDCAYRAMQKGARWMIATDFDEWLLLRPAGGHDWPPPGTTPSESIATPPEQNNLITTFAQAVVPKLSKAWVHWDPPAALASAHDKLLRKGALASAYQFRSAFFCITCRPAHGPASAIESAKTIEKLSGPDFSWTKPGLSVPFVYSSPVRHMEWFREGRRTKTLVDPWAWRFTGIHVATMTYLEWAVVAGPCSWAQFNSAPPRAKAYDFGAECALKYLDAFGPATYVVDPGDIASNTTTAVEAAPHSRGGLVHLRVAAELRESLVDYERKYPLNDNIQPLGIPLEADQELSHESGARFNRHELAAKAARRLVEYVRVGPGEDEWKSQHRVGEFGKGGPEGWPRLELVEDWSFVEIMGRVLAHRLAPEKAVALEGHERLAGEGGGEGWWRWWMLPWLGLGAVIASGWSKQRK